MRGAHALLLAAGAGRRFGGRKLLAAWQGEPLVRASARIALAAPVESCIAVTGSEAELMEAALAGLGDGRLRIVRAPDWSEGLAASLRHGLAALPPDSHGIVVFLADMPLVPAASAGPLLAALERGAVAAEYVTTEAAGSRPAHPVAFSSALFPELAALTGDQGGRKLLAGRSDVHRIVTEHPGSTFDVDRPADLADQSLPRPGAGPAHLAGPAVAEPAKPAESDRPRR
jgi:molybdenum cofactor cytidylyltransferase